MQALLDHYKVARNWISRSPYSEEVRWQESLCFANLDESHFLREYAWVVLNSGFKEAVIRKRFNFISLCFCDWESAKSIAKHERVCVETALTVFRNRKKLEAITFTSKLIARDGFEGFSVSLRHDPALALKQLPYIGEVTSLHLAKNLGADVVKPDRHLVRLATRFGYSDPAAMCKDISANVGDRISVTDLVLWRFEERTFALRGLPRKEQDFRLI
jgi:hypothetical protein